MKLSLLSLLPLVLSVQHVYAEEPQTTKQFLDQANAYLGRGEYNLALQSYDAAIGKKRFLSSFFGNICMADARGDNAIRTDVSFVYLNDL